MNYRPLYWTVIYRRIDWTRASITHGCPIDAIDPITGYSALHHVVEKGDVEHVKLLLAHGADVNIRMTNTHRTPISCLPYLNWRDCRSCEILQMLLEAGAKWKIDNENVGLDLDIFKKGSRRAVELLLEYGFDLTVRDRDWNTPLHYLAENRNEDVFELLLNFDLDVNIGNTVGESPLYFAVRSNNTEYVRILLRKGADPNCTNIIGPLPLHRALYISTEFPLRPTSAYYKERGVVVRLLMENGARLTEIQFDRGNIANIIRMGAHAVIEPVLEHLALLEDTGVLFDTKFSIRSLWFQRWLTGIRSEAKLNDYYECRQQIERMRLLKVDGNVSFLKVLVGSIDKVSKYVRNQDVVDFFTSYNIDDEFPRYAFLLKKQFERAIEKRKLMSNAANTLCDCFQLCDPDHVAIENIISCLSIDDLRLLS